jgi:Na+/melibiose symporter-like transporter
VSTWGDYGSPRGRMREYWIANGYRPRHPRFRQFMLMVGILTVFAVLGWLTPSMGTALLVYIALKIVTHL